MSPLRPRTCAAIAVAGAGLALSASPLMGIILPPALVSSVGNTDLGSVQVGKSAPLAFTLSSTAAQVYESVTLSAAPVLTGNTSDFSIAPGTCITGTALSTTRTCTSTITFAPTSPGVKTVTVPVAAGLQVATETLTGAPCDVTSATLPYPCALSFTVTGTGTAAPTPTVAAALTPSARVIRARRTASVTLTPSNSGTVALSNVVTTLRIPAGFIATKRGGGTVTGRTITWTTASLAAGASTSYTITLRPIGNVARRAALTATVSATGATSATAAGTIVVVPVRAKKRVPVVG